MNTTILSRFCRLRNQCFLFSRIIGELTPTSIYFYYLKKIFSVSKYPKIFYFILKKEALYVTLRVTMFNETNQHVLDRKNPGKSCFIIIFETLCTACVFYYLECCWLDPKFFRFPQSKYPKKVSCALLCRSGRFSNHKVINLNPLKYSVPCYFCAKNRGTSPQNAQDNPSVLSPQQYCCSS